MGVGNRNLNYGVMSSWIFWGILKNFLEGSVDRVIYRDYIVSRRFLFTVIWPVQNRFSYQKVKVRYRVGKTPIVEQSLVRLLLCYGFAFQSYPFASALVR